MSLIYVMVGGAVGSLLRYLLMSFVGRITLSEFPYSTLAVNIVGSFLMGVWIAAVAYWLPSKSKDLHLLFAVGLLGGFTTFSTFSLDLFYLIEKGAYSSAVYYILSSIIASVIALVCGMFVVRIIV
ncbi:MAG: fluoride efflux transporter CrcB [Rickettsiales bacterium]